MDKNGPPPAYSSTQPGWASQPPQQPPPAWTPAQNYQPAQTYQPGYGQPAPPAAAVIISSQPTNVQYVTPVGPTSSRVTCPSCRADVQTRLQHEPTTNTHLMALCLFCFLCWPCVCLPYCMDSCQNANHYCPNCNAFIGTYQS
ncbi:lipopolysaccharide-induced tumor necrosis factor-alpha factor homolog isoform X1 [Episyrphus balteatus]|uniref:lipopolysaccharide-induced tumor necrosis factor-alpha factor homolog isoform X1 n=1 Tax=Episyrphus balteatus TaxID=286459 RepID=UPI002485515A|nr:lipopolysaccharide-induced tumor necrosis factor-alpha factor homolog isoform X1 [Episyrphus balteatus]